MLLRNSLNRRFFGKKSLYIWGYNSHMGKEPRNISSMIEGDVSTVGIGEKHMGIITSCGKLYMMGNISYIIP